MINNIEAALPKKASSPEETNPEEKAFSDNAKYMRWSQKKNLTVKLTHMVEQTPSSHMLQGFLPQNSYWKNHDNPVGIGQGN